MTLRTRLILAFVALSVVPLAAVTWYSYVNSARAMRDVAARGADILTTVLSQRMELITAQLSNRVDNLMDMEGEQPSLAASAAQSAAPPSAPASTAAASPPDTTASVAAPSDASAIASAALEEQVAERLGDAAMLLKNVQLRPLATSRGRQGSGRDNGRGRSGSRGRSGEPAGPARRGPGGPAAMPAQTPQASQDSIAAATPRPARPGPAPPAVPPPPPGPPTAPGAVPALESPRPAEAEATSITIDLAAIRRQMFREIVADRPFEEMSQSERQRVIAELNQRLLGIEQGLKIGAAELQKQADEARREAEAEAPKPAVPAPAPAPRRTAPSRSTAASAPVTRRLAMTGNSLNVRREQNGVVRQIDAELNMPVLLETVFSKTRRDADEIPFAIDPKGQVYASSPQDRATIEGIGGAVTDPKSKPGTIRLPEWIVVTTDGPIGSGLKLGIARPVGDALNELRSTAMRSAGLGIGFILLTLIGIVPLSVGLTRSLSRLNDGVRRIASGDYTARLTVRRQDEVGQLAQSVNQMAEAVVHHRSLALQQERLTRELELGREIQHNMLPHSPLQLPRADVYGSSEPAGEVGGDFFNYFQLANGELALLIGDVSGKGVAAALLMANIQASLRTRLVLGQPLTQLADEIDRDVQANSPEPVYATLFVAIFDPASALLRYVNAGHNPPLVRYHAGRLERLESTGLPIGLLGGRGYSEKSVTLGGGDVLFCYTDGCVEASNGRGEMFGIEALERELQDAGTLSAAGILRNMDDVLRRFRGAHPPDDDATMMIVEVKPEVGPA